MKKRYCLLCGLLVMSLTGCTNVNSNSIVDVDNDIVDDFDIESYNDSEIYQEYIEKFDKFYSMNTDDSVSMVELTTELDDIWGNALSPIHREIMNYYTPYQSEDMEEDEIVEHSPVARENGSIDSYLALGHLTVRYNGVGDVYQTYDYDVREVKNYIGDVTTDYVNLSDLSFNNSYDMISFYDGVYENLMNYIIENGEERVNSSDELYYVIQKDNRYYLAFPDWGDAPIVVAIQCNGSFNFNDLVFETN